MMKGFVTFDGPNGVGKSTVINLVYKHFKDNGLKVYQTKEPTNSSLGNFIRENQNEFNGETLALMVAADRYKHVHDEIIKKVDEGYLILCDRFILSSYVLQTLDGVDQTFVENIHSNLLIDPDLSIVMLADSTRIRERIKERNVYSRFEKSFSSDQEVALFRKYGEDLLKDGLKIKFVFNDHDAKRTAFEVVKLIEKELEDSHESPTS